MIRLLKAKFALAFIIYMFISVNAQSRCATTCESKLYLCSKLVEIEIGKKLQQPISKYLKVFDQFKTIRNNKKILIN